MKLIRLLAGSLVSSALFSSSVAMAFPMPKSVKEYFEDRKDEARKSEEYFRLYIARECPFLDCVNSNDFDSDNSDVDSFYDKASKRDYGKMPFKYDRPNRYGFRLLKFKDKVLEKPMVFSLFEEDKMVCYIFNGKKYGKGPKDNFREIRAIADYLLKEHFFNPDIKSRKKYKSGTYRRLKQIDRNLFFYVLACMVEECTDEPLFRD